MRILFSYEYSDPWIYNAYKTLYNSLSNKKNLEFFCTTELANKNDIEKYNIIDYKKINLNIDQSSNTGYSANNLSIDSEFMRKYFDVFSFDDSLKRLIMFKIVISIIQPDLVIIWNGMIGLRGFIKEYLLSKRISLLYAEKGMLPNSWYIDEDGVNSNCSLNHKSFQSDINKNDLVMTKKYINTITTKGMSAWGQPNKINNTKKIRKKIQIEKEKILFFPAQVDEDSNIILFSDFHYVSDAIELVLNSIPSNTLLLVKPHPKASVESKNRLTNLTKKYNNIRIIENINIWDVIEISDLIISINSTVAFEALLKSKKVILLGKSLLSKVGLIEKTMAENLKSTIVDCLDIQYENFDNNKVLYFLHFLLNNYYIFPTLPFPDYVISRILKQSCQSNNKLFSKPEIMDILYSNRINSIINLYGRKKAGWSLLRSIFYNPLCLKSYKSLLGTFLCTCKKKDFIYDSQN